MTTELTDDVVALQRLQSAYADVVSCRAWDRLVDLFRPETAVHLDLVSSPSRTIVGPTDFGAFVGAAIERFDRFTFVILNSVDGRWWFDERRSRSLARTGPDARVFGLPDGLGPLGNDF